VRRAGHARVVVIVLYDSHNREAHKELFFSYDVYLCLVYLSHVGCNSVETGIRISGAGYSPKLLPEILVHFALHCRILLHVVLIIFCRF